MSSAIWGISKAANYTCIVRQFPISNPASGSYNRAALNPHTIQFRTAKGGWQ
jgi:hypothetical protein